MVELDSSFQPFTVGSEIEVAIDEEGFKGALFRATILKLPTSSNNKNKNKALVEYKTLVTENRSRPLKEFVDALSLRPIPPDITATHGGFFEEGHIVDAADKDGWWTGVVYNVLENGDYSVFFFNPMHVLSFQPNQLRLHHDWVRGLWFLPQKMDISFLRDQMATIFEDANILKNVEPESSKNAETNNKKDNTYSINARNDLVEQPSICDENYASFASTLSKRKRSLISKSRVPNPVKGLRERNVSTPDGLKKIESTTSREEPFTTPNSDLKRRIYRCFLRSNTDSSDQFGSPKGSVKMKTKNDVDGSNALNKQGARFINCKRRNIFARSQWTRVIDEKGKEHSDVIDITPKEASKVDKSERNEKSALEEKQMTQAENPDKVRNGVQNSNNQTKEKGLAPKQQQTTENSFKKKRGRPRSKFMQDFDQRQACENSCKRKRGRPRKLIMVPTTAEVKEQDGIGKRGQPGKLIMVPTTAENKEQDGIGWKPDKTTIKSYATGCITNANSASSIADEDDDRPLSMWLGEMKGPARNNLRRRTRSSTAMRKIKESEQVDAVSEVTTSETPDHALDKNQGWPFEKNSPVWSAIDSLEVFKLIPQMPHFHPLSSYKEECREGLAIGYMVTFSTLAEKVSKLQFDNIRDIYESMLASLYELEQHGFNTSILCNRVNQLLCIKDTQMQYLKEIKLVENKKLELSENKTKLAEESKAIEQKIAELQNRQSSIKREMKTKDLEVTTLQSRLEIIRGYTEDAKRHFEKQTTLPL